ncbi:MAG: ATP-grasp domain-containing protein [Deltaproteobacteria bacterium]|nr:ATP-grasp domain-containing protein [Deltaproteobacteria bacterium]
MRVGILSDPREIQGKAVAAELEKLGASVVFFPPTAIEAGMGFALLEGEVLLGDDAFGDVRAWWVRSLVSQWPARSEVVAAADKPQQLFELGIQARERLQLVLSWLCGLADQGTPIVNPPWSGASFLFKPYQLALMRRAGVPVPRTLYTTSPHAAKAFRAEVGPAIVKPIAGGAHTRDFDDPSVQESLHLIQRAPIVMQERVFGEHVRVTIIDREIVSAVVIDSAELDYRDDPEYHQNARYKEAELSTGGQAIALRAAEASRLSYTGIDILRNGDAHVVLECNTSPIYMDIERRMGHPISAKLAAFLWRLATT